MSRSQRLILIISLILVLGFLGYRILQEPPTSEIPSPHRVNAVSVSSNSRSEEGPSAEAQGENKPSLKEISQEPIQTGKTEVYSVKSQLRCTHAVFQSDVILVTSLEKPLSFQLNVELETNAPEGYVPVPAEFHWSVTSGRLNQSGTQAQWAEAQEGVQEIRVEGKLTYLPPKQNGFFAKSLPTIEAPFSATMKCLFPRQVDSLIDGKVNGFLVGLYPSPTDPKDLEKTDPDNRAVVKAHSDIYQPPKLFYPITPETYSIRIFKDYTLGDFDLDPRFLPLTYPRYIVIHPRILHKIDRLETFLRDSGLHFSKLKIFYGYRSPHYNLGSREDDGSKTLKSPFSTHMYGLAVDILIDEDDDLVMDDLNNDGQITESDARVLYRYIEQLDKKLQDEGSELMGGVGWYPHHDFWERGEYVQSPYVHMDARGYIVHWVGKDTLGVRKRTDPYGLQKTIPPWPW